LTINISLNGWRRQLLPEERQAEERAEHGEHRVQRQREGQHQQPESPPGEKVGHHVLDFAWDLGVLLELLPDDVLPERAGDRVENVLSQTRNDRADEAGNQPAQHGVCGLEGERGVLLLEIDDEHAACDDPEAATRVRAADDGQRGQHPDEQTAQQRRLVTTHGHGRLLRQYLSRNTPDPSA
jgi:hypothetical protein